MAATSAYTTSLTGRPANRPVPRPVTPDPGAARPTNPQERAMSFYEDQIKSAERAWQSGDVEQSVRQLDYLVAEDPTASARIQAEVNGRPDTPQP